MLACHSCTTARSSYPQIDDSSLVVAGLAVQKNPPACVIRAG
jgi:hypothetical protein